MYFCNVATFIPAWITKESTLFLNNPFYDMFSTQLYLAVPNVRSNNIF